MYRTHTTDQVGLSLVGTEVTLSGWVGARRDHGGVAFIDLRDSDGLIQVVIPAGLLPPVLRPESCIKITGLVKQRPTGSTNSRMATGDIEVSASEVEILSLAAPLPFQLDEYSAVSEEVRLKHRYLDLRRPALGDAIRMRSEVNKICRDTLYDQKFLEIETPTLTASTPEGARDFLVPARLQPGKWYALPQSPQLFKQLLMVGGMEKYFQVARCYRDEDSRGDRQPEFTQLDIEMSFVSQSEVMAVGEQVARTLWKNILKVDIGEVPRMPYEEAMRRFGSDKPDLRYEVELVEMTDFFKGADVKVFQAPYVGAVVMPDGASQSRPELDQWQQWAKQRNAPGLAYMTIGPDGLPSGQLAKRLTAAEAAALAGKAEAKPGDCVFFAAGEPTASRELLGAARVEIARKLGLAPAGAWSFLWVVDAPMFLPEEDGWTAVHHPFTSPSPEWEGRFKASPGEALSATYDLVCNGNEIGGGSIRIHSRQVQEEVFEILGLSPEVVREQFGFLLDAFDYGPPPHGGIAFGLDRVCMLLANAASIREVIAFPKTSGGFDPLTGAPTAITAEQRLEAGVDGPQPQEKARVREHFRSP